MHSNTVLNFLNRLSFSEEPCVQSEAFFIFCMIFTADLPVVVICVKVFSFFSTSTLTFCSKRMFIWNLIAELVAGSVYVAFEEGEPN